MESACTKKMDNNGVRVCEEKGLCCVVLCCAVLVDGMEIASSEDSDRRSPLGGVLLAHKFP